MVFNTMWVFIMKLTKGDKIGDINLPSVDGKKFNIKNIAGKKTIITFYRFATCPFCNLRINEIINRYNELNPKFNMIGIFDSTLEFLTESMKKHDLPFTILADENFEYFKKYEVEQSIWKFLVGSTVGFFKILRATAKGYFPMEINGMTIVPVDILINEKGIIEKVYYGKNTTDHLSFEEIRDFSLS